MAEVGQLLARIPGLLRRALRIAEQIDLATCRGVSLTSDIAAWEREGWRPRWGMIALVVILGLLAWDGFVNDLVARCVSYMCDLF
jgi:hypothetical protein